MRYFNIILFIFLITSCTFYPHRLDKEKESELLKKEHGFLIIDFNDNDIFPDNMKYDLWGNKVKTEWGCEIKINDNYYFRGGFKSEEKYKIPVPVGQINIVYFIHMSTRLKGTYYELTSGRSRFKTEGTINLDIKSNSIFNIKIIRISDLETVLGCVGGGQLAIPWLKTYQRVAFEVEKVEDLNNNNSK